MFREFPHNMWHRLIQGSVDQAATFATGWALTYAAFATGVQNPANKPSYARTLTLEAEYIDIIFAVADTDNDQGAAKIYFGAQNGPGIHAVTVNPIQAGTATVTADPVTGATLTNFRYADLLTVSATQWPFAEYDGIGDEIAYLRIPTFGADWVCGDIKQDDGAGTDGTDTIIWYREVQGPYIASATD